MNAPNDPNDPLDPTRPQTAGDADARIDALARAAGSELRRPAPPDGIGRARRTTRRRQVTRAALSSTAVLAVVAIGVIALTGRDDRSSVVPATVDTTVDSTDAPETTSTPDTVEDTSPGTVPTPTTPDTEAPTSVPTTSTPTNVIDPDAVYVATDLVSMFGSEVSTIDRRSGGVRSTFVVDQALSDASRAAQDALLGRTSLTGTRSAAEGDWLTTEYVVGSITYSIDSLPTEVGLDALSDEALARFDRCAMGTIDVSGADATALPQRVRSFVVSADGRSLVTVGGQCPAAGTLGDGQYDSRFDASVTLFDAARPDLPGIVLIDGISGYDGALQVTFSPDGRYVAVQSAGEFFGSSSIRFFDRTSGEELAPVADGCSASGTRWSRFIGPWIGESSVALSLFCDGAYRLLVRDLVSEEQIAVEAPVSDSTAFDSMDVDFATYERPTSTWFTICDGSVARCWIGQGAGGLLELPGVEQASFLPLGFEYGG